MTTVPNWPPIYAAQFTVWRGMSYQVASILTVLALTKTLTRVALSIACVALAAALGLSLCVVLHLSGGFLLWALLPVAVLLAGVASASFTNSEMNALYQAGSAAQIQVADGYMIVKLAGRSFGGATADITRVVRFRRLTIVEFANHRATIIPTKFEPHRTTR